MTNYPSAAFTRHSTLVIRHSSFIVGQIFIQEELGDGLQLHIRGTLVDLSDLGVPEVFLRGILLRVTITSENLQALACYALGYVRGEVFGHRGLLEVRSPGHSEAG